MTKLRIGMLALFCLLLGIVGGYLLYGSTKARFDVTTTACVAMQEAVKSRKLTIDDVRTLGQATGQTLQQSYTSVASKLDMPKESVSNASPESVCSQFLVGVNSAKP